jgi:hypothetical protein
LDRDHGKVSFAWRRASSADAEYGERLFEGQLSAPGRTPSSAPPRRPTRGSIVLVTAASTSYQLAEYTALLILGVLFVALLLRAFGALPGRAGTAAAEVAPLTSLSVTPTSVAPPRHASSSVVSTTPAALARPSARKPIRRGDAIAALLVGVLLVGGVIYVSQGSDESGPWSTPQGVSMKAGFMGSCQSGAGAVVDCNCIFTRITSQAPYDTPAGL